MSHCVEKPCQFTNLEILERVCQRLGIRVNQDATVRFYDGREVHGTAIHLPGWRYPALLKDQELVLDNYGGAWGDLAELERLQQQYSQELVLDHAQRNGWQVTHQAVRSDGTIEINIEH